MLIVMLRDETTGDVTKAFSATDADALKYLDAGVDVYDARSPAPAAPVILTKVRVDESSRVTDTHTVSADIEDDV